MLATPHEIGCIAHRQCIAQLLDLRHTPEAVAAGKGMMTQRM